MSTEGELVSCPGGCGNKVHLTATECPSCGFRPDGARYEDMMGSLGLISSILAWIGLETVLALISLDSETTDTLIAQVSFGIWMVGSVLLLVVMVLTETIRRRELSDRNILASRERMVQTRNHIARVLLIFLAAVLLVTIGVVLLGFLFSTLQGSIGVSALGVGLVLIYWALR